MSNNWIDDIKKKLELHKVLVNECWLYKGKVGRQWIGLDYKTYLVHRLAACVYLGFDLNDPHLICHEQKCPNPGCYNPEHIYIGDSRSNKLDEIALGRYKNQNTIKTHCPKCGGEYTSYYRKGNKKWRRCRNCSRQPNAK